VIRSAKSLVAKHLTPEKWEKLANIKTKTSGFTLAQVNDAVAEVFFIFSTTFECSSTMI
jgi:hypothetical protein